MRSRAEGWVIAAVMMCTIAPSGAVWADLTDPTRPPDFAPGGPPAASAADNAAAPAQWDLTSTLVSPTRREAVINGEVVTPGSRVGRMTVHEIRVGRVVLEGQGRRQVLSLTPGAVKRPAHGPAGGGGAP